MSVYLDPHSAPPADPPPREQMAAATRELHDAIDARIRESGVPYLHPDGPSLQTDLFGGEAMREWQIAKGDAVLSGEVCWSDLPQIYARYGTESTRALIAAVAELEAAPAVVITDSGQQASALAFDALLDKGDHALISRQVYNKSKAYLRWLGERMDLEIEVLDDAGPAQLLARGRERTRLLFVETFTNPLMRAIDPEAMAAASRELKQRAPGFRLIVDDTIASPWALAEPLLGRDGIDVVTSAGTKSLGGEDRDMWGYVASTDIEMMNAVMDLQAMRGGRLSWRAARAIHEGLPRARERMERRCESAAVVARFLSEHPRVAEVFHPSLADHPDREVVGRHYRLKGSLLSMRLEGADEDATSHFCDVLAMTGVFRYALSFDGLTSKVNHHKSVSEFYTPDPLLRTQGIDRLARLGIGVEDPDDLIACLNWALWRAPELGTGQVRAWVASRRADLGL